MTVDASHTVVIVGAGHSGGRLARHLRSLGYPGRIVILGEEPDPPYERPALSKDYLNGNVAFERLLILTPGWCKQSDVIWKPSVPALSIDRKSRSVATTEGQIGYDILVLATGSRARPLKVPGAAAPGVLFLRTRQDAVNLRQRLRPGHRVIVVGGGLIGLEVASTASALGCDCTVVEHAAAFLSRIAPPDVASLFQEMLKTRGIPFALNASINRIVEGDDGLSVHLTTGERYDADTIVVGIGAIANSELAAAARLDVGDGILVDSEGRTSDPSIFAIGDVACNRATGIRLESWHNAEVQAERVAKVIAKGNAGAVTEAAWFWTDQFGLNVQFVGVARPGTQTVWLDHSRRSIGIYLADRKVSGGVTFSQPRAFRELRKWLAPGSPSIDDVEAVAALRKFIPEIDRQTT